MGYDDASTRRRTVKYEHGRSDMISLSLDIDVIEAGGSGLPDLALARRR
jgi:hypothetical protein